jgi:nucleoside-diphosphate-sugar epimerase
MKKILITGGNGFIAKALTKKLIQNNYIVNISSRKKEFNSKNLFTTFRTGEIDGKTKWDKILNNVECVVHCAATTSNMNKTDKELLESFRKVNIEGTINLARQSVSMGVKRFIFLSSIKVNGEMTFNNSSFKYYDIPNPSDATSLFR